MVKLYWKDKIIDLTDYVDWRTIVINETADETLNTAIFEMPSVKGKLQELDLSRPLPRLALIEFELEGTKQFLIATDNVEEEDNSYKHKVECVSVAKLLLDTTNAGLTITQPSGDIALYYRSYSVYSGYFDSGTKTQVPLLTIENSIDTTEIDELTLKKSKEYMINFSGVFYTNNIILEASNWYVNYFDLIIEIGGVKVHEQTYTLQRRSSFLDLFPVGEVKRERISFGFAYENIGEKEVKAYVRMNDLAGHGLGSMEIEEFKVTISTTSEEKDETIYLDYVVEKLLKNDMNEQRFFLDETSKGFLSTIKSHEYTLPESYLWLQLQRIAEHIKAFPTARMGEIDKTDLTFLGVSQYAGEYLYNYYITALNIFTIKNRAKYIVNTNPVKNGDIIRVGVDILGTTYFYFYQVVVETLKAVIVSITPYEELLIERVPNGLDSEHKSATIEDYASRLEINAENVYSEQTTIKEITSLRAEGELSQVTTDNIIIPTQYGIGEIVGFRIKTPKELSLSGGWIVIPKGTWVDIDPIRILRKEHYDTLISEAQYNLASRRNLTKNSTLYFNMGQPNIYGLSYIGGQDKTMLEQNKYIRAIYEIMLATLCVEHEDIGTHDAWDEGKVVTDNEIIVEIEYRPHKPTSASIYKSDQSGFEFSTSKFLNDSASLNSPDVIASYTQAMADRSGGTIIDYTGITEIGNTADILTTYKGMPLFSKTTRKINNELVGFSYQYIKDFVFHSSYEGYNKKERLEEVPRDSVVDRVNKKNTLIIFSKEEKPSEFLPFNVSDFVSHLVTPYENKSPTMVLLSHKKDDEVKSLLPVSTEAYGRTIEFLIKMKDNYSAGLFKYAVGVGDNTQVYQQDHRYTNEFGRVEEVSIKIFNDAYTPSLTDAEIKELPKVPNGVSGVNAFYQTEYTERKDARERSIYSLQVSYLSENNDIIIYDAIAKFSNMVSKKLNSNIVCAKFWEMPSRTATTIDSIIERKMADAVISLGSNYIEFSSSGAYVFYDKNSKELLLAVGIILGESKLYFRGVNQ